MLINGQVRPLTPKWEQEKEEEWSGLMAAEQGERYGK
jgi:hypothetical protein